VTSCIATEVMSHQIFFALVLHMNVSCTSAGGIQSVPLSTKPGSSLTFILLMWRIGRTPNSIPIYSYIQQDATSHSLFISGNCSTCFGWYFHPSSRGAYNCIYSIWYLSHRYCYLPQSWNSSNSSTIAADSSNGVTNTRCCRYSCMRS
jgi:hypothetical protein